MTHSSIPEGELATQFTYTDAIPYEPGVTRRDPSPIIKVDGSYYFYCSRATVDASGYYASVWCASSPDGRAWTERGEAIPKGGPGAWDENGVFTPTTLLAEGKCYVFYTAVPKPFTNAQPEPTKTAIGVAVADSPLGPFTKFDGNPVLRPGPEGDFDDLRVDDACLTVRGGRYWLYYKGREKTKLPSQTKMGLAIADCPTGPYVRYEENPVIDSGHEVCVWPHREGVAAIVMPTGPQGSTTQYAPDGVHFTKQADVVPPTAPGPYRTDGYADVAWGEGITWGVSLTTGPGQDRPHIARFECDLRAQGS